MGVIGYPTGGDTLSITAGVVSRIELKSYGSGASLLVVQIDAAINPGNSGGPVFNIHGDCVGIAFEKLRGSRVEGVGYIIPIPVLHHFLEDYEKNGSSMGFPTMPFDYEKMESAALRRHRKMQEGHSGVLVQTIVAGT